MAPQGVPQIMPRPGSLNWPSVANWPIQTAPPKGLTHEKNTGVAKLAAKGIVPVNTAAGEEVFSAGPFGIPLVWVTCHSDPAAPVFRSNIAADMDPARNGNHTSLFSLFTLFTRPL